MDAKLEIWAAKLLVMGAKWGLLGAKSGVSGAKLAILGAKSDVLGAKLAALSVPNEVESVEPFSLQVFIDLWTKSWSSKEPPTSIPLRMASVS